MVRALADRKNPLKTPGSDLLEHVGDVEPGLRTAQCARSRSACAGAKPGNPSACSIAVLKFTVLVHLQRHFVRGEPARVALLLAGMGRTINMGSPLASASEEVRPPGLVTSRSAAAMKSCTFST